MLSPHRLALLALALCATPAHAVVALDCRYETVTDLKSDLQEPAEGGFGALLTLGSGEEGSAQIEINVLPGCVYEGSFSELEVSAGCTREKLGFHSVLHLNRLTGAFELTHHFGTSSVKTWSGHCTAGKKLF